MKNCGYVVFGAVMALASAAFAEKVDATFIQPLSGNCNYADALRWLGSKPAGGGGVATFANQTSDCNKTLTINQDGVTLGGIEFGDAAFSVAGSDLTFTGEGVLRSTGSDGPLIGVGVNIAAGSTMTKRGKGKLSFNKGISGSGKLVVAEGTVVTQDGDHFLCGSDLEIRTGHISWYLPNAKGDIEVDGGNLTFGPDRAQIVVTKGEITSYKATLKSLTRSSAGGFLELRIDGELAALGEGEKILVKDRISDSDYIDASVVSRGHGDIGDKLSFLRYDAEKGFVPAETAAFVQGQSADGKVAVISEDTTITENAAVSALQIENGAQLTIASGVTLTIGDGVHPAGVIWSGTGLRTQSSGAYNWKGPGKLQFAEGADGILYYNGSMPTGSSSWTGAPCIYIDGLVVAGNRGVTFAGVGNDNRDYGTFSIRQAAAVGWTGGTHLLGIRLQVNDQSALTKLPGPIYILGDMGHNCGAQLRHNYGPALTQEFFLGGRGVGWAISHGGALSCGGNPSLKFSNLVTLLNDTFVVFDNKASSTDGNGNLVFRGGLTGPGAIVYYSENSHSRVDLAGPADFEGGIAAAAGGVNHGVYVTGPTAGTGLGPISTLNVKTPVGFRRLDGTVASNDFSVAGAMDFTDCTNVTFLGEVVSGAANLNDGAIIACGKKGVSFGQISKTGPVRITAGEVGGLVRLGAADDLDCAMIDFADGPDGQPLDIEVDAGEGRVVTIYNATNSGAIRVMAGTLRLSNDVFARKPCTVRLDAGDGSSILTDEEGGVTNWTSIADAPAFSFARDAGYAAPTRTEELNGRKVLTFTRSDVSIKQSARLVGSAANLQRTVIFVVRPRSNVAPAGLFGVYDGDRGLRLTGAKWEVYPQQTGAFATKALYLNGEVSAAGYFTDNAWQILTAIHKNEPSPCPMNFVPALGAYVTYDTNRAFNGDLAEVVMFPGILDDDERKAWENALAEKWGLPTPHPGFEPAAANVLGGKSALDVGVGATFDLNGVDATVASLSGVGTIVNSSSRAAKLTVTGANSFAGKVIGKVTLVNGAAATAVSEFSDGATLAANGATVTLGTANGGIVTDGLVYWLDAMKSDTILTDDSGAVTSWVSRAGTVKRFHNPGTVNHGNAKNFTAPMRYDAAAVRGRPGVYFGYPEGSAHSGGGSNVLVATSTATKRTVILVGQMDGSAVGQSGFWQSGTGESGFYITSGSYSGGICYLRTYTGTTYHRYGYLQHALGINTKTGEELFYDHTMTPNSSGDFMCPSAFIIVSELDDNANNFSTYKNATDYLGVGYHKGYVGWLCEVLAYDRCLTADEVRIMEGLLMDKWMRGTPSGPYVEERPVLASGSGLAVAGGGAVDCGGAALTLSALGGNDGNVFNYSSLTVTDRFVFEVVGGKVDTVTVNGNLTIGSQAVAELLNGNALDQRYSHQPALSVTGAVTGGGLTTIEGLPAKWNWKRIGETVWAICKTGMVILIHGQR